MPHLLKRILIHLPVATMVVAIGVLSLWENPTLPDSLRTWSDKTLHTLMYSVLGAVAMVAPYKHHRRRITHYVAVWIGCVAYGGLLEILQATCTQTRTGDWADVLANMVGSSIGVLLFYAVVHLFPISKHV